MRSAISLALALASPLSAQAFDLTGTWEGKYSCKAFDGASFSYSVPTTLEITQTGQDLRLQAPFQGGADMWTGLAIDDDRKAESRGAVYFVHCGMTEVPGSGANGFDETGFAKVKTKANGGASFKATTTLFIPGAGEVSTCKWSYKRIDTADPGVPACPAP